MTKCQLNVPAKGVETHLQMEFFARNKNKTTRRRKFLRFHHTFNKCFITRPTLNESNIKYCHKHLFISRNFPSRLSVSAAWRTAKGFARDNKFRLMALVFFISLTSIWWVCVGVSECLKSFSQHELFSGPWLRTEMVYGRLYQVISIKSLLSPRQYEVIAIKSL